MTEKELKIIDRKIERMQNYMQSADKSSQFYDACAIALDALFQVKILSKANVIKSVCDTCLKIGYVEHLKEKRCDGCGDVIEQTVL